MRGVVEGLLLVWLWGWLCGCQFSPVWQASPYIQSRALVIVSNGQKVTGTYSLSVNFATVISDPIIALAIPQLRIINGNTMGFRQYDSDLTVNGFTHNLVISGATTIIYYMQCRYIAFNTAVLGTLFQTYNQVDKANTGPGQIGNGPSVGTRTSSFGVSLSPNAVVANAPVCLVFLSGVTASSSNSFNYQLNLTCAISTANSATVTVTVYPETVVQKVSFYVVVWDSVLLAVQSFLFVDYTVTTTYYNSQKSVFSLPYGYLDKGYFGGMTSFSTTAQQELNFTLSSLTLNTTQSSLFDSASQFQVRVRNCSSSISPFYNRLDGLCYSICPNYTYTVTAAFLCMACPSHCVSCLNGSVCTNCSVGMSVVDNLCVCLSTTYLSGSTCIGCHISCLTCAPTGQYYNCLTCDPSNYRTAVTVTGFNKECKCNSGYTESNKAACTEICGDGTAITDACDDGNTASGDGCSSSCVKEDNFTCTNDGAGLSWCYYTGAVTIEEVKIFKEDYENKFKVFLRVSPWIDNMAQLANAVSLTYNLTNKVNLVGYSVEHSLLVLTCTFQQEIENEYMMVYLKPFSPGIFSQLPPTNCTFQLNSDNGFKLKPYTSRQYQVAAVFHYIAMILGYLIFASAFLYIFGRLKWMGNLLFFSLQFQYLSIIIVPRFNPMFSGLSMIKTVMGYNEVFGQEGFDLPKYASVGVLNFNKQYNYNVNVMVALQALGLFMYLFYNITYRKNALLCKKYGDDPEKSYRSLSYGKILQFFNWEFFMFWTFFNMFNQLTATVLYTELPQPHFLPLIVFNMLCILLAIAPLLIRRKEVKSYTDLLYCQDRGHEESVVSLTAYVLMFALLGVALTISKVVYYLLFLIPVAMIVYICCRSPFQSKWMRAAYFVNCCCIFIALLYNLLTTAYEDTLYYLPFGSLITIMFDWIFNLVVWGREAYIICKYGGKKDLNEVFAYSTKNSSNDDNADDFFNKAVPRNATTNQPLLNTIIKQQAKTKRSLRRDQQEDETPTGIKEDRQARLDEEEQEQRSDLKKRRENWMRQMKEVKEVNKVRERTRHELDGSTFKRNPNKIRTTAQKGLELSQLQSVL